MNYEHAKELYMNMDRPSLEEFIRHAKENFLFLGKLAGDGFVLQAIEIAEKLKEYDNKA